MFVEKILIQFFIDIKKKLFICDRKICCFVRVLFYKFVERLVLIILVLNLFYFKLLILGNYFFYFIVNGGYIFYLDWFECSVICGEGVCYRYRLCISFKFQFGGCDCSYFGVLVDIMLCVKGCKGKQFCISFF